MSAAVDDDFAEFVRSRQRGLLRAAYLVCGDRQQAEDVVQEALSKLASRWGTVRDGSPDAYVRRIIYHDAVSSWRRWGRRQSVTDPVAVGALLDARPGGDPVAAWVEGAAVRSALASLPVRQRAVMVLRYYEDLSEAQIAETLALAPGTVKTLARGALISLRRAPAEPGCGAHHGRTGPLMTRGQLWETFDRAADEVGGVDFVDSAWTRGQALRRRRQALTGAALVGSVIAVIAIALAALAGPTDGALDRLPAGTPSDTSADAGRGLGSDVGRCGRGVQRRQGRRGRPDRHCVRQRALPGPHGHP